MPEMVPAAYPPRPLVTSHSRARSISSSAARASDHGIRRINSRVLMASIVLWDSLEIMTCVATRDRHAKGPHFSYWLSRRYQRYRPPQGWLLPPCQYRYWRPSGGEPCSARPAAWPHTEYRQTGAHPQHHQPQESGPTGHPAQADTSYPESETAHQVSGSADGRV